MPASHAVRSVAWARSSGTISNRLPRPDAPNPNRVTASSPRPIDFVCMVFSLALFVFWGGRQESGQESAEQGFASAFGVVHELKQGKIVRQLLLRDATVWPQPGAQQRPDSFHRVDVDFTEAIAILVAGILAATMVDGFMAKAPLWQPAIDHVLIGIDQTAQSHARQDQRLDRRLLNVGQQVQDHGTAALDHAEDRRLLLLQGAAAGLTFQSAAPTRPAFFATAAGCPLWPAVT